MLSDTALVSLTQARDFLRADAAASLRVDAEYVGAGTGTEKVFSLDYAPVEGSLRLYVGGALQAETTHFSISGSTVTFVTAPTLNTPVTASYDRAAESDTFEGFDDATLELIIEAVTSRVEEYTGRVFIRRSITESHEGGNGKTLRLYHIPVVSLTSVSYRKTMVKEGDGIETNFPLGNTPRANSLHVYVDSVLKEASVDYVLSGQVVTFSVAPVDGSEVLFQFDIAVPFDRYTRQLHLARLVGEWYKGYEYVITYVAGHGANRNEVRSLVPDAATAALIAIANAYENRLGLSAQNITGVGSVNYAGIGLPDASKVLLEPLRTELC